MTLVKCNECGNVVSSKAKLCPHCGAKPKNKNYFSFFLLILLGFLFLALFQSALDVKSYEDSSLNEREEKFDTTSPVLKLENFNCGYEHGYSRAEGLVKNISSVSLENVMVVGKFYSNQGQFIKSDSSLIDYNPILSGQSSPFKILSSYNPEIKKCEVEFKFLSGRTIPHQ